MTFKEWFIEQYGALPMKDPNPLFKKIEEKKAELLELQKECEEDNERRKNLLGAFFAWPMIEERVNKQS